MSTIRLLTFDLDDTLWDVEAVVRRADADMMNWLDEHYPRLTKTFSPADFWNLRKQVWQENPDIRHNLAELRRRSLVLGLRLSGHAETEAEQGAQDAFAVFFKSRNTVDFFPDVLPVLSALRERYTLYALSNGGGDIATLGLAPIFTQHLSAVSVGAAKPDPAMFLKALQLAQVEPGEVIHIGDHPAQDIAPAQALGMKTVWVNIKGADWPEQPPADAAIGEFRALPAIIARLDQGDRQ